MAQMGGHAMYLKAYPREAADIIIGEDVRDIASVLSGYADAIVARTYRHKTVQDLARFASVPVINAMTDEAHPVQILTDLYTVLEHKGVLQGLKLVYMGEGRGNTAQDMVMGCAKVGVHFTLCCPDYAAVSSQLPAGFGLPGETFWQWALEDARESGAKLLVEHDPIQAVKDADAIYTDSWIAFDVPEEKARQEDIRRVFMPYQVNKQLLENAKPDAMVMHCLPAYKGNEITADVFDDPRCYIYRQAENRMHVQKGILAILLGHAIYTIYKVRR
jgi:ornithine carbamoyltransferase